MAAKIALAHNSQFYTKLRKIISTGPKFGGNSFLTKYKIFLKNDFFLAWNPRDFIETLRKDKTKIKFILPQVLDQNSTFFLGWFSKILIFMIHTQYCNLKPQKFGKLQPHLVFQKFMSLDTLIKLKLISQFHNFLVFSIFHCFVIWGKNYKCVRGGGGGSFFNTELLLWVDKILKSHSHSVR